MTTPEIEPLFEAEAIRARVGELGREIGADIGDDGDPLVLTLLSGSVVFLADLIRAIPRPLRFEFIHVQYSGGGGVLEIQYPIPLDVHDQDLLIIKDVVSSGVIESYLANQFRALGARDVRFVALLDLPDRRKAPFTVDYALFQPTRRATFAGYGLKHEGRFGSLPYIGILTASAGNPLGG